MKKLSNKNRMLILVAVAICILFFAVVISANIGFTPLSIDRIIATIFGFGSDKEIFVIWELRIPRTIVAIFAGACLAVAGAVMQGVTRNPMATPSMLGVSSGASFGILLVVFLFDCGLPMLLPRPIAAIIGGFAVFAIVYAFAIKQELSPNKLILNGIAINSCIGAITLLLTMKLSEDAYLMMTLSQAGNLTYATWPMIVTGVLVAIPCIVFVFHKVFCLNILNLGDDMAIGLGINLKKERQGLLIVTILLSSISVYVAGTIGFVGLIAPHMARRIVGSNFKMFIPISMCLGSGLVVIADILSRFLSNTVNTQLYVPVGIIISVLGAPYLLYLLYVQDR